MTTLGATLSRAAQRWPDRTALVFEGRRWNFRQWNAEANRAAHAFAARGIARGDRVADDARRSARRSDPDPVVTRARSEEKVAAFDIVARFTGNLAPRVSRRSA